MQHDGASQPGAPLPGENPLDLLALDRLRLGDHRYEPGQIIAALSSHLTQERMARVRSVVDKRTLAVAVVVEGLANAGNVSAVMRSAEALGFLPFHVVLGDARYKTSRRTTQGAEKWLDVFRWETPAACAAHLHARGYRLVAAHLEAADPIDEIDFTTGRTALVFGNEREGLSEAMLALCDQRMVIPIPGFVQSFNISVAAAIAMYHVQRERRTARGTAGDLTSEEREVLTADYCVRSVGAAESILMRSYGARRR